MAESAPWELGPTSRRDAPNASWLRRCMRSPLAFAPCRCLTRLVAGLVCDSLATQDRARAAVEQTASTLRYVKREHVLQEYHGQVQMQRHLLHLLL